MSEIPGMNPDRNPFVHWPKPSDLSMNQMLLTVDGFYVHRVNDTEVRVMRKNAEGGSVRRGKVSDFNHLRGWKMPLASPLKKN